jgi:hypothetical protein
MLFQQSPPAPVLGLLALGAPHGAAPMEDQMKLSDTQAVMLSKASRHPQGLVPPPACPPAPRAQIERKLLDADLMEEAEGSFPAEFAWRHSNGRTGFYRITDAGLRAIGIKPAEDSTAADDAVQHHQPEHDPTLWPNGVPVLGVPDAEQVDEPAQAAPLAEAKPTRAARAKEKAAQPEAPADGAPRKRKAQIEAEAAADRGELPEPPDFSAATHAPYRKRLAKLVELAQAGDAAGLRAEAINPTSTSPRALIRYRDLAVRAIEARAKGAG